MAALTGRVLKLIAAAVMCLFLIAGQVNAQPSVGVHCCRDLTVAHSGGEDLGVDTLGDTDGRMRMPQVVRFARFAY